MSDQADKLRKLVFRAAQQDSAGNSVPVAFVCGAAESAGASSVARQVAANCAQRGIRTVLIDAKFDGDYGEYSSGDSTFDTLVDALSGARTIAEILRSVGNRLRIAASATLPASLNDSFEKGMQKIVAQCRGLKNSTEIVVIDAGSGPANRMSTILHLGDALLLVCEDAPEQIVDGYALLKRAKREKRLPPLLLAVNGNDVKATAAVHHRLGAATRRYLDTSIGHAVAVAVEVHPKVVAGNRNALHRVASSADIAALTEVLLDACQIYAMDNNLSRAAA